MIGFPQNPNDGDVYQANEELVYQYSKSKRCWIRISGVNNVKPATAGKAGLMSAEDFAKVEDILLPAFSTTLSTDECDTTFTEGRVELVSTKASLEISEKLKLFNPDGSFEENDFVIHDNTVGIDFRINIPQLIDELKNRGTFTVRDVPGDQGDRGDQGDPGIDRLDTGPVGEDGIPGSNAPFSGSLIEDISESLPTNKAVVDVANDPNNPSKIVVTIGNIGNPDVGPKTVSWKDKNSQWLLGMSDFPFNCNVPEECAPVSQLFHIDIGPILEKLIDRAEKILGDLKEEKQGLANNFITSLASVFSQQREAVCCALEAVISRKVNQNVRDIWANGRYQAAQAGYAFTVSDQVDELLPRTDPQQFPTDFVPKDNVGPAEQNVIINGDFDESPVQFDCDDCYVQVTLNRTNLGPARSVNVDLPAFDYVATITDCCVFHEGVGGSGVFNVTYNDPDTGVTTKRLNDRGLLASSVDREEYLGDSMAFRHDGGTVRIFLDQVPSFGAGSQVVLCLQPSSCYQSSACVNPNPIECDSDFFVVGQDPGKTVVHALGDDATDVTLIYDFFDKRSTLNVYHPPVASASNLVGSTGSVLGSGSITFSYDDIDDDGNQVLVSVVTDEPGAEFIYAMGCSTDLTNTQFPSRTSMISISHIEFYERGWRTKNSCAVHVDIDGSEFIVVYRSIGSDCSCGGGEYSNTPFISDLTASTGHHPALAWPTVDGNTFFGLPRGEDAFIEVEVDRTLENMILDKIQSGDVIATVGDPSIISTIAFPVI